MTEILTEAKRIVSIAEGATGMMVKVNLLSSLITTIESQKEEIKTVINERDFARRKAEEAWKEDDEKDSLIETLKAITELAIKGLKEIDSYKKGEALVYVQEIKALAKSTISEIERLSQ